MNMMVWNGLRKPIEHGIKGSSMNEELKKLVIESGAPIEMLDELWFNVFCQQFADRLIKEVEDLYEDWKE